MKLIKYQGLHPECLDGFPEDCDRSKKGALHMRPGRTMELTDDEYGFLKAQRPDIARHVIVLRSFEKKSVDAPQASAEGGESAPVDSPAPMDDEGDPDESL